MFIYDFENVDSRPKDMRLLWISKVHYDHIAVPHPETDECTPRPISVQFSLIFTSNLRLE
jgi:hypothetical protein